MTSDLDRPETGAEWTRLHGARRPFHAALAAGVLLVLAFLIGGVAIVLEHTRRTALNAAELELDRSTKVAQSLFNRHMLQVDSALVSLPVMLGEVVAGEDGAVRRKATEAILRSLNDQNFAFRDLILLSPDGTAWASAQQRPRLPSTPLWMQASRLQIGSSILLGPEKDPMFGDWVAYLARSVIVPGQGRMIAIAEIAIDGITTSLSSLITVPGIRLRLERQDGRLLAMVPQDELAMAASVAEPSPAAAPGAPPKAAASEDRRATLSSSRVTLYDGIQIEASLQTDVALADWLRDRNRIIAITTLAGLLIVAFGASLSTALKRQARLEGERQRAQLQLEDAIQSMSDGFVMWDADDRLIVCNERFRDLYAASKPFIKPGALFEDIIRGGALAGQYPQAGDDLEKFVRRAVASHREANETIERLLPDGRWILVTERRTASGGVVGIRTEITAIKQAQEELGTAHDRINETMAVVQAQNKVLLERDRALRTQNILFDAALNNMPHGLLMADSDGAVIVCNERFRTMLGHDSPIRQGMKIEALFVTGSSGGMIDPSVLGEMSRRQLDMAAQRQSGTFVASGKNGFALSVTQRPMSEGGFVAIYEDVTEKERAEQRIRFLAHHDPVTGLPNRILFRTRLETMLAETEERGEQVALLCLDLDKFKDVNDTLGHPAGDLLLAGVAARLRASLRRSDLVARLGGDEFAVALRSRNAGVKARAVADRIIAAIGAPFTLGDRMVTIGVSIGAALAKERAADVDGLLKNADLALYEAKGSGRGTYAQFEPRMEARLLQRMAIEEEMGRALREEQFSLAYQPLFELATGRVLGFEALLRWNHPERGVISPADFVPIAEETGLINEIGAWAINRASADIVGLPADVMVAVNLSPVQLKNDSTVSIIIDALGEAGLAPSRLELEITESALLGDDPRIIAHLHRLRDLGVRIVLDDFGTGYSSLSYLRRFPFHKIKIDKLFVREATTRSDCAAIVTSVVELAQRLGMATTAEGIETKEQLDLVRRLGCTEGQGYLLGKPKPILAALAQLDMPAQLAAAPRIARGGTSH